jgi:N-methylhydantoinase A/oxoprolinase/acetone carboxylase beta subunit
VVANFSIGAGGGSIAFLTSEGDLQVGPRSAGSVPGPACYDQGGTEPTVTDADLVLGYIDPDNFLGGRFALNLRKAQRALRRRIADPLGIDVTEAARRIRALTDGVMGQEIYKQTSLKGHDPSQFVLFAFGGAGPVHACDIAGYADVDHIMTFSFGSEFNAFGTACMNVIQSYEQTHRLLLYDPIRDHWLDDLSVFNGIVEDLVEFVRRDLTEEGFDLDAVRLELELDMNYSGQQHTVRHPVAGLRLDEVHEVRALAEDFNRTFARVYGEGAIHPEGGIEIQLFKLTSIATLAQPPTRLANAGVTGDAESARSGDRDCWWGEKPYATPVYDRRRLGAGYPIPGPALVEDVDTVVAVSPGWTYEIDDRLAGHLRRA